ncbi:hypothetical protein CCAX7_35260 [Capsulimonas corticalis]|uniref:Uncharacterized protein n=1 Tax=Capsulimonas corticalis TaxID=2219043 RepID=A0A402CY67_9BACT|nr:hypothetical protein [Capsulimonas corticalis]BDI31475.1 hypothetical protein CCAX7_35260 [Capsulimonas corticalis]
MDWQWPEPVGSAQPDDGGGTVSLARRKRIAGKQRPTARHPSSRAPVERLTKAEAAALLEGRVGSSVA